MNTPNTLIYFVTYGNGRPVYQSIFCDKIVESTETSNKWRISPAYTDGKEYFLWFPKKALIGEPIDKTDTCYKIAKWFNMNGYIRSMFERFGTVNM